MIEVKPNTPTIFTAPIAAVSLAPGINCKLVLSFLCRVRSMGTSAWVAVGDRYAQEFRYTSQNSVFGFADNLNQCTNLAGYFIKSENGDAVIELFSTEQVLSRSCE